MFLHAVATSETFLAAATEKSPAACAKTLNSPAIDGSTPKSAEDMSEPGWKASHVPPVAALPPSEVLPASIDPRSSVEP
jgi:hypothetical protein